MSIKINKRIFVFVVALFLTACQTTPNDDLQVEQAQQHNQIALQKIDEADNISPVISDLLLQADAQYKAGKIESAFSSLERAIRIAPRFPESYYRLGELHYLQGNNRQANSLAQKSISLGASGTIRKLAQALINKSS